MQKKKKIMFVTAPYHAGVVEVAGRWVPLYYVYLAGAVRAAGYEVVVYDAMTKHVGHEKILEKIKEEKPDYLAMTAITCTLPDAIEVLENAKKALPDVTTLLGGIHPTFMFEEVFSLTDSVDYIVRGEGEITLPILLDALEDNSPLDGILGIIYKKGDELKINNQRAFMTVEEWEAAPKAWDALDWKDYKYFIIPGSRLGAIDTSRGCDRDCSFCSQRKFWKQSWRARSPESLMEDVIEQHEKHGVNVILLTDDYPTIDKERWEKWLDLLIEADLGIYILMETRAEDIVRDRDILHKYRKAGIIHIYIGTEATDQETMDLYNKGLSVNEAQLALSLCAEHNIITETSMILGHPDETKEKIEKTVTQAISYKPDFCHFLALSPWPYADMYKDLKDYIEVYDYKMYNLIEPIIAPKGMTLEDIDMAIVDSYRRFYMEKFKELEQEGVDEFKKRYIKEATRRIMTSSFIVKKLGRLELPKEMRDEITALKKGETTDNACPFGFTKSTLKKVFGG